MTRDNDTTPPPAAAQAVLDYWFGGTEIDGRTPLKRWFAGGKAVDEDIRERFAGHLEKALAGALDGWAETPSGRLALIVLLDQFTRHLHRGTAAAFAGDAVARRLSLEAIDRGEDRQHGTAECGFLYMPLEHSERLADQDRSVALQEALVERAPAADRKLALSFLRYARNHRDIIARFGRFPHRNAALGRTSTEEEAAYLDNAPRYGQ